MRKLFACVLVSISLSLSAQNPAALHIKEAAHGKISKEHIVKPTFPTFVVNHQEVKPASFVVYINSEGEDMEKKIDGSSIDDKLRKVLSELKPGSVITVSKVELTYDDDSGTESITLDDEIRLLVSE